MTYKWKFHWSILVLCKYLKKTYFSNENPSLPVTHTKIGVVATRCKSYLRGQISLPPPSLPPCWPPRGRRSLAKTSSPKGRLWRKRSLRKSGRHSTGCLHPRQKQPQGQQQIALFTGTSMLPNQRCVRDEISQRENGLRHTTIRLDSLCKNDPQHDEKTLGAA